jgi:hypothetical protein
MQDWQKRRWIKGLIWGVVPVVLITGLSCMAEDPGKWKMGLVMGLVSGAILALIIGATKPSQRDD